MNLNEEINNAREICVLAHQGQFRRDGVTPYHTHPFAVAEMVRDQLKPAALLHDVFEDSNFPLSEMLERVSTDTVATVMALTRGKTETYDSYMASLILNSRAVEIKIADMEHNLSCEPSDNSRTKIAKWLPVLKQALKAK